MAARSLLLVFRRAPYGRSLSRAGYDVALAAAAFEQPVSLLFMDDGVWQLMPEQRPEAIGARSIARTLESLPLYDIDRLYVDSESLAQRALAAGNLVEAATPLDTAGVRELMAGHDQVLVF
ncbi:MAG: sulfurtransferase complex subunit TusC [Halieaceae bacterium]|nr:sulfurtransferase complex subunit TusC [Halieaceae bacterium]